LHSFSLQSLVPCDTRHYAEARQAPRTTQRASSVHSETSYKSPLDSLSLRCSATVFLQTIASHQTATANLGVGSGIASHYTRFKTRAQHLHRGSYWWFGFQSLLQSIPIRTLLHGMGGQAYPARDHRTMTLRLSFVQQLPWGVTTHHAELTV